MDYFCDEELLKVGSHLSFDTHKEGMGCNGLSLLFPPQYLWFRNKLPLCVDIPFRLNFFVSLVKPVDLTGRCFYFILNCHAVLPVYAFQVNK